MLGPQIGAKRMRLEGGAVGYADASLGFQPDLAAIHNIRLYRPVQQAMRQLFNMLDNDKNGFITRQDFGYYESQKFRVLQQIFGAWSQHIRFDNFVNGIKAYAARQRPVSYTNIADGSKTLAQLILDLEKGYNEWVFNICQQCVSLASNQQARRAQPMNYWQQDSYRTYRNSAGYHDYSGHITNYNQMFQPAGYGQATYFQNALPNGMAGVPGYGAHAMGGGGGGVSTQQDVVASKIIQWFQDYLRVPNNMDKIWLRFDRDGNGVLDANELAQLFYQVYTEVAKSHGEPIRSFGFMTPFLGNLLKHLSKFDANGDGRMDKAEYNNMCRIFATSGATSFKSIVGGLGGVRW